MIGGARCSLSVKLRFLLELFGTFFFSFFVLLVFSPPLLLSPTPSLHSSPAAEKSGHEQSRFQSTPTAIRPISWATSSLQTSVRATLSAEDSRIAVFPSQFQLASQSSAPGESTTHQTPERGQHHKPLSFPVVLWDQWDNSCYCLCRRSCHSASVLSCAKSENASSGRSRPSDSAVSDEPQCCSAGCQAKSKTETAT